MQTTETRLGVVDAIATALSTLELSQRQLDDLRSLYLNTEGFPCSTDGKNAPRAMTIRTSQLVGSELKKRLNLKTRYGMSVVGFRDSGTGNWKMMTDFRAALDRLGWFGHGPVDPLTSARALAAPTGASRPASTLPDEEQVLLDAVQKSLLDDPAARAARLAAAPQLPEKYQQTRTAFNRNPDVIAAVLLRAAGICEKCLEPAPFRRAAYGTPYLEAHHKVPLAAEGSDTVGNAIALCPNCHREAHYGQAIPTYPARTSQGPQASGDL